MNPNTIKLVNNNLEKKYNSIIVTLKKNGFKITKKDFPLPVVSYDLKGKVAGKAYGLRNLIKLNKDLISNPNYLKEMSEDTLYHELVHLFIHFLYKTQQLRTYSKLGEGCFGRPKPHGIEWKTLMVLIDEKPSVTHNFEVLSGRKMTRITYLCDCREHEMTKRAHHKILDGSLYKCRKCKEFLKLKPGAYFRRV